jgi:hypothetical protein
VALQKIPFFLYLFNMEKPRLLRLELLAPLVYAEDRNLKPFDDDPGKPGLAAGEERIFLFEIDPAQGRNIEPDPDSFLGSLVFSGRLRAGERLSGQVRELPAGRYLFVQEKRLLNREEGIDMALEAQKDGLWEGLQPEPRIYFRYLSEEGQALTQVFRPYRGGTRTS